MRTKKFYVIFVGAVLALAVSLGFFSLSGDDPTTAVSFSNFTPVEPISTGDFLGTWAAGAPIPSPGSNGGAGVGYSRNDTMWLYSVNGDVNGGGLAPGQFRLYNITTNTWTALPNYTGRAWTSATRLGPVMNTNIYVVGGLPSGATVWSQMTGTLQRYSINTNTWTTMTAAPTPCGSSGFKGYQDSLLYAVGGMGTTGQPITNVQLYNATSNTWRAATSLPIARANGWMVIKSDTIYYGCGAGPTTATFNNNIYVGVISQTDRSIITWTTSAVTYPGTSRHRMDADLFGCFGMYIGPGAGSSWWGTGTDSYTWNGGNSAFVNVGPIPFATSDAHVGSAFFQRGNYKVWKAVVATGLIMSAPYHILNTQIYTDSCEVPLPTIPEVLYYTFDETGNDSTQNYAVPGRGFPWAPVTGLTMGGTGQWGSSLVGTGGVSTSNNVNTGWATNIGTSSWTISLWLNNITTTFGYYFGDPTASSWRCFLNGAAGTNNITLRGGGMSNLIVSGVVPGPTVVTFVYDSAAAQLRGYKNGVLDVTLPQATPLNINGTGPFLVGGYSTSAGLLGNMDEFRLYDKALSDAEVAAAWNHQFIISGIDPVLNIAPEDYLLSQNYPNPFNPTTTINYKIPTNGLVSLKVYDALGKEVGTLVNEVKSAGSYIVDFNGANLSSGVYFYKIVVGDFAAVKKMVLLK